MVRRAHQQQYRRVEPDVGVLSCASASTGADRGAAQVRWRPALYCDDYPGAVVLIAPSNKRLKLAAPVRRRTGEPLLKTKLFTTPLLVTVVASLLSPCAQSQSSCQGFTTRIRATYGFRVTDQGRNVPYCRLTST